jgi:hypothetical protein
MLIIKVTCSSFGFYKKTPAGETGVEYLSADQILSTFTFLLRCLTTSM